MSNNHVQKDGIEVEIRRENTGPNGAPLYDWWKNQPMRTRDSIKYVESRSDEFFSIYIAFLPPQHQKFDVSLHWKLEIKFEGEVVYRQKITSQQVQGGWTQNIKKGSCGSLKDLYFCFVPARRPNDIREEDIRDEDTNQDTISICFYRLKVKGIIQPRVKGLKLRDDDRAHAFDQKKLLRNPELAHAHRPSGRAKPKPVGRAKEKEPLYDYLQIDDDNPWYIFDFKLRDEAQLRELGLIASSNARFLQRAGQARQVLNDLETVMDRKRRLGIRSDDEDGDSDDCQFLGHKEKTPPPAAKEGRKRTRQTGNKNPRPRKKTQPAAVANLDSGGDANGGPGPATAGRKKAANARKSRKKRTKTRESPMFVQVDDGEAPVVHNDMTDPWAARLAESDNEDSRNELRQQLGTNDYFMMNNIPLPPGRHGSAQTLNEGEADVPDANNNVIYGKNGADHEMDADNVVNRSNDLSNIHNWMNDINDPNDVDPYGGDAVNHAAQPHNRANDNTGQDGEGENEDIKFAPIPAPGPDAGPPLFIDLTQDDDDLSGLHPDQAINVDADIVGPRARANGRTSGVNRKLNGGAGGAADAGNQSQQSSGARLDPPRRSRSQGFFADIAPVQKSRKGKGRAR